jgi:Complex I intermediate-associated protein 30 (CIA30)
MSAPSIGETLALQPVFDFSDSTRNETDRFERIDDVIMGGISSSTLRQMEEPFARWSGVCREDGGGFCGVRTLPFKDPIDGDEYEGIFLECRLSSDNEPDRRIWKMTTRCDVSRGEQLYQAMFQVPAKPEGEEGEPEFSTIYIPFSDFRLVRGARLVNQEPMNTTALYQIGITLSKFSIAENMTTIPNFRAGYFELQIKQIGLFKSGTENSTMATLPIESLMKDEALAKRPILLKMLLPLSWIVFTEQSQRRKSAMRILTKERGLNRLQAIRFGLTWRAKQIGIVQSLAKLFAIMMADTIRQTVRSILRFGLVVPVRLVSKSVKKVVKLFSRKEPKKKEKSA